MKTKILVLALLSVLLTSCGTNGTSNTQTQTTVGTTAAETTQTLTEAATQTTAAETTTAETTVATETTALAIATGDDVIATDAVGFVGMEAISAAQIKEGEYAIGVDSSSSMFKIAYCLLKVKDGNMTAEMTINSKSYDYLFAGTAEEAAKADQSAFISPKESDGQYIFELPVEALDREIKCASFSHKKQLWYDRTLVFRADSIDPAALPQKDQVTASSLGLADGNYTVEVKLEGGSGRASVQSPAELTVKDSQATAKIIWSSNKYDYMRIGEEKYLPTDTTEFSVFEIPVSAFDTKLKVAADTTAMSTPHEIEYTLYFDSASIKQ